MKNKTRINTCLTLMLAACAASLEPGTQAAENTGTKDAKSGGGVEKRDPFWPVGYMPRRVQQTSSEKVDQSGGSWREAMKKVVINGVSNSSDDEAYAVINGELKSVGDTVSVRMGTSVYTWAVDAIEPTDGGVRLRRVLVR